MKHAAWRTLDRGGQFVLLGSAPDAKVQARPTVFLRRLCEAEIAPPGQPPDCAGVIKPQLLMLLRLVVRREAPRRGRRVASHEQTEPSLLCRSRMALAVKNAAPRSCNLYSAHVPAAQPKFARLHRQAEFDALAGALAGENAAFCFYYDEPLSHLIYAACDVICVPSLFEPCGLTQVRAPVPQCARLRAAMHGTHG